PPEFCRRVAWAAADVGAARAQLALAAVLERLLLAAEGLAGRHQVLTLERQRVDAEIAIEAQRLPQRVEGSGQRVARRLAQRDALPAVRPAARRGVRVSPRIASATALLAMRGSARLPPQRSISSTSLSSASKPMPAWLTSWGTSSALRLA